MIRVENVTRTYGELVAVNDISFSIPRGQIVGLLGHNGAGKSTTLKMLTGYLEPNSGSIVLNGIDIRKDRHGATSCVGYLPENCPLYSEMTVIDYLGYIAELRSLPEGQRLRQIKSVIARTHLEEKACVPIATLSKGYRQRVGIAQAIIHDPDILVLDEPTSGLDPSQIHEIRDLIKQLSKHATVILSTHILQEVEAICNRVIIIMNGKIAKDASLEELTQSNRLVLTVESNRDITSDISEKGKLTVSNVVRENGFSRYVLDVQGNPYEVAPAIAEKVIRNGCRLLELHPEYKDLESVFRELSSHGGGRSHV